MKFYPLVRKLKWKGVIYIYWGETARITSRAVYLLWKKYYLKKLMVAYASGRIIQTTVSLSFPKWVPNFNKYDSVMLPIFLQAVAGALAQRDNPLCTALAVGLDGSAFLSYKAVYTAIYTQKQYLYLTMMEIILFGEPVFTAPSVSEYDPLKYFKRSQSILLLCTNLPGSMANFIRYHLEMLRCQKILTKALFVGNTANEQLLKVSKLVIADTAFSSLALGQTYSTGIAVYNVLNSYAVTL
jgi:hypothetical protein